MSDAKDALAERDCAHPGCKIPFEPARSNQLYCEDHRSPYWASWRFEQQKRAGTLPPSKGSEKAKPKAVMPDAKPSKTTAALASLREKAELALTLVPQPTGTGAGGDLYQQLSARREQMLADIAAIERVLAIL
jgi:hypothetical protein